MRAFNQTNGAGDSSVELTPKRKPGRSRKHPKYDAVIDSIEKDASDGRPDKCHDKDLEFTKDTPRLEHTVAVGHRMHESLLFSQTMSSRQLPLVGRPLEEYLGYPDLTSFPLPGFNNTPIQLGFVPYQHAQATMHRTSVQQQPLPYRVHPQHSQQVRQAVPARQHQPPYGMLPHPSQFPILSGQSNFAGASAAAQIGPSAILVSQLGCLQWASRKLWVQWLHSFRTPYESSAAHIVQMLHQ